MAKNNMKRIRGLILLLVIAVLSAGFYFGNDIYNFFAGSDKDIPQFEKEKFDSLLNEIKEQIFIPPPLRVENKFSIAVLTKSGIIEETNNQRIANNLTALYENEKLADAALFKANDMFAKQYFEHVSPSGAGPSDLADMHGYQYIVIGENLILGNFASDKEVVDAWMNSPGHRENILNPRYAEIGVAIIKGTYEGQSVWIGVQEFGRPLSSCSSPDASLKQKIETNQAQLNGLSGQLEELYAQLNAFKKETSERRKAASAYNQIVDLYNSQVKELKEFISEYNNQVSNFNNCIQTQ